MKLKVINTRKYLWKIGCLLKIDNQKAFTMLEVIIYLSFAGLLLTSSSQLLSFNTRHNHKILEEKSLEMELNNTLAYIEDEIRRSDYINPEPHSQLGGLGFVLKQVDPGGKNFTYISYEFRPRTKTLYRLAYNTSHEGYNPSYGDKGTNPLLKNLNSIQGSFYKEEAQLVNLSFQLEGPGPTIRKTRLVKLEKRVDTDEKF